MILHIHVVAQRRNYNRIFKSIRNVTYVIDVDKIIDPSCEHNLLNKKIILEKLKKRNKSSTLVTYRGKEYKRLRLLLGNTEFKHGIGEKLEN